MSDEGLTKLLKRQYGPKNIDSTSRILSSIYMDRPVISSTGKSDPKANGPPQKSYRGRTTVESTVISVPQKQTGAAGISSSAISTGNSPVPARGLILEFKSPIICHRCGKECHIRPNFPEAEAAVVKTHQKQF